MNLRLALPLRVILPCLSLRLRKKHASEERKRDRATAMSKTSYLCEKEVECGEQSQGMNSHTPEPASRLVARLSEG
jgi:hypothetical protein